MVTKGETSGKWGHPQSGFVTIDIMNWVVRQGKNPTLSMHVNRSSSVNMCTKTRHFIDMHLNSLSAGSSPQYCPPMMVDSTLIPKLNSTQITFGIIGF